MRLTRCRRASGAPWSLAAQRPAAASVDGALRGAPLVTSMEVAPLSLEATAAVLAERGGARVSASFVQACRDATGGNPLLTRRLADGFPARGVDDPDAVPRLGPYVVAGAVATPPARLGDGPSRLAD